MMLRRDAGRDAGRDVARARGEEGSALVEVTWLGVLLMVPIVYMLIAAFAVQNASYAVAGAARAAARAYSLAPDPGTGQARGNAAIASVFNDHEVEGSPAGHYACSPAEACLAPGSRVTVTVRYTVPLPWVPDFLTNGQTGIGLTARQTVPIGQFSGGETQ